MDHARGSHGADPGNIGKSHLIARFGIYEQVPYVIEVLADVRMAPNHHIEYLLFLEQATHGDAADQLRCGPTHVSGLKAVSSRPFEVDLDIDHLLLRLGLDLR